MIELLKAAQTFFKERSKPMADEETSQGSACGC